MPDPYVNAAGLVTRDAGPRSRSIASLSGSSQLLMPAQMTRKELTIQNTGSANIGVTWLAGTAVIGGVNTFTIAPGGVLSYDWRNGSVPGGAVYVIGTAGQPVLAIERAGNGGTG